MNPNCATCQKTVYPTERFNAINQTFHKLCFKCVECGVVLNMKTYQSYEQKPYCKAHLPQLKAQGVTGDSVEMARLKNVTNMTSQIQYKADFEKMKGDQGSFGAAALDAPEIRNNLKNSHQVSNVKYHQQQHGNEPNQYMPPLAAPTGRGSQPAAPVQVNHQPAAEEASGATYTATFDYHPTADDELDFNNGDLIINAQLVAEGWLFGTNKRTGKSGLVPEPYTQAC